MEVELMPTTSVEVGFLGIVLVVDVDVDDVDVLESSLFNIMLVELEAIVVGAV